MSWHNQVNGVLDSCLATFGGACFYVPRDGDSYELKGIFSNQYQGIDPETGFEVAQNIPNLGIKLDDWPAVPKEKDKIIVEGVEYIVQYTQKDGEGGAIVFMQKRD
jgi:hypothetical protein